MNWSIYIEPRRIPTMRDLEECAEKIGALFWIERLRQRCRNIRRYWFRSSNISEPVLLGEYGPGEIPDWSGMLKNMGVNYLD